MNENLNEITSPTTSNLVKKTIWEHLQDLQSWFIWSLSAWVISTVGVWIIGGDNILSFLMSPIQGETLYFQTPGDSLMFLFKIFGIGGLVISLPFQIWLLWRFISPALNRKEQGFGIFYILAVCILAMFGLGYGYYTLIPSSLKFLLEITPKGTKFMLTAVEYVDFLMTLLVLIILVFQTPILVFGLIRSKIAKPEVFIKYRKVVYFTLVVGLCMVLPPDLTLLFFTILPITLLYEASILLGKFSIRSKQEMEIIEDLDSNLENNLV